MEVIKLTHLPLLLCMHGGHSTASNTMLDVPGLVHLREFAVREDMHSSQQLISELLTYTLQGWAK